MSSATDEHMMLSVRDQGPGVPPEHAERIFQPGSSPEMTSRPDSSTEGRGFGLHIAKGIVEAHGGRIWVETSDAGARFCVILPLTRRRESAAPDLGA